MDNEKNTSGTPEAGEARETQVTHEAHEPEANEAYKAHEAHEQMTREAHESETHETHEAHEAHEAHETHETHENEPETHEVEFVLASKEDRRSRANANTNANATNTSNSSYSSYSSNSSSNPQDPQSKREKYERKMRKKEEKASAPASRRFVAIVLVIAVIASGLLGAGIATLICKSNKTSSNLNYSNLASATGSELTVQEIVALNEDAVVEINTESTSQNYFGQSTIVQGAGSGVIVKENGYIVTNNHVIDGASTISVTLHDGNSYSASLVGTDSVYDIAVLKISASGLTTATLGDSDELQVGDLAVAIGNPLGKLGGTATAGIISSLERRLNLGTTTLDLLQTDAAINPGNSGGGLFNQKGELIGIVVAKSTGSDVEGLGFAIPINNVASVIDDLIDDGQISSKPAIGISVYDVDDDSNSTLEEGTYIGKVVGTKAKEAGLKEGDRIISIDGKEIEDKTDLISRVRKYNVGDKVTLVIERNGSEKTIETELEESSAVS
jgi:serine protease Do